MGNKTSILISKQLRTQINVIMKKMQNENPELRITQEYVIKKALESLTLKPLKQELPKEQNNFSLTQDGKMFGGVFENAP